MLILSIDTCCMAATAALTSEERMVAQTVINHKKTHSQKMMPQIEDMLKNAEVDISDISAFAAAVGPGSFTGIRIGTATIKAMAQATGKPCIAVSALHALANNASLFDGVICPILDARRNQVYNALFEGRRGKISRLCNDRALPLETLLDEIKRYGCGVVFTGDGVLAFRSVIEDTLGDMAVFAPDFLVMNLAGSVGEIALQKMKLGETVSFKELAPQYIRLSQAEQEREKKCL